ncbi:transcription factor RFX4-like [Patiria miniata]|uniref:DNA-binding protein RFX6 n=1 Tax=Patiria miniata TaxID=46514 RepID=A0A913ZP45_PATMI|nr:transcription factor RFX4-like [Patiria miniata]
MPPKRQASTATVSTPEASIDPIALATAISEAFKSQAVLDLIIPALSDAISHNLHQAMQLEFVKRDEQIAKLQHDVRHLESRIEQQEQYSRRDTLIVHGIPEPASPEIENAHKKKIIDVAQHHLSLDLGLNSIDRAHRIGSRLDKSEERILPLGLRIVDLTSPASDVTVPFPGIRSKSKHMCKMRHQEPHPTPRILKWLQSNYELADGVCIPRNTLYVHYTDFCKKTSTHPMNAASFGKMIRQKFPQLTTRRLGTRGQSKYHYYGIAVQETSEYYEENYSSKVAESTSHEVSKREHPRQTVAYSPRCKLGTLLPPFPDVKDIKLPGNISEGKVCTFLMMYRTHCQRILDTVIRASFDEVETYLLHFWQGMPPHMLGVLDSATVADIVGLCDSILYKAIAGVLMPSVTQTIPESLTQVIGSFVRRLEDWLRDALDQLPESLCNTKFTMARYFSRLIQRQGSLNHLCQASKATIQTSDVTSQMADDWSLIDHVTLRSQTLYAVQDMAPAPQLAQLCEEFGGLLEEQSSLEAYTDWLDSLLEKCVEKHQQGQGSSSVCQRARRFMLIWSCLSTKVMRDMTLHSSPSFGSFHLLHMTLDEYVHYKMELIHTQERADSLLRRLKGETQGAFDTDDIFSLIPNWRLTSTKPSYHTPCRQQFGAQTTTSLPANSHSLPADCYYLSRSGPSSDMASSYMTCSESRGPSHVPGMQQSPAAGSHLASLSEFGDYPPWSIYSSENSAFTPVTSNTDCATAKAPYPNNPFMVQDAPRDHPFHATSAFTSSCYHGDGVCTSDAQKDPCLDCDAALSRSSFENQSEPVGARYVRRLPPAPSDATCALMDGHQLVSDTPYHLNDREFHHFANYAQHQEPFHTSTHANEYRHYGSSLCS